MSTSAGCCSRPAFDFPNHNEVAVAPAAEQFPCRVPRQKVYKKYQVNSTWDAPAAKASGEAPPSLELVQLVIGDPAEVFFTLWSLSSSGGQVWLCSRGCGTPGRAAAEMQWSNGRIFQRCSTDKSEGVRVSVGWIDSDGRARWCLLNRLGGFWGNEHIPEAELNCKPKGSPKVVRASSWRS